MYERYNNELVMMSHVYKMCHTQWHILYTSHTKTLRHTKPTMTLKPYHKVGVVDNHGDNTFPDLLARVAIELNVSVLSSRRNRWFTLHFKLYLPKKRKPLITLTLAASKIFMTALEISGPMPSPGIMVTVCICEVKDAHPHHTVLT